MPRKEAHRVTVSDSEGLFPFQLANVRLYEVHAERCQPGAEKKGHAAFTLALKHSDEPPEAKEFGILLTFEGQIPAGEKQACQLKVGVEGMFVSKGTPSEADAEKIEQFRNLDSAVLLWPYLRQYVHDLTTRMGFTLPPLPTIDVRVLLAGDEKQSSKGTS